MATLPIPPRPPPNGEDGPLAKVEREKLVFEKIKHARERWWQEDCLVNHRITWLLQTQGVIGTAYAFLRYRETDVVAGLVPGLVGSEKIRLYVETLRQFERILQLLGGLSAFFLLLGIGIACVAQHVLDRKYKINGLDVSMMTTIGGQLAAVAMPLSCLLAWAISYAS
jgi:hypothetical protein